MTHDTHVTSDRAFAALATGLLDGDDEDGLRRHLATCEPCRNRWDAFVADREESDDARHLPAAMIARWDRARAELRGLERESVRQHLARCRACQEDLRVAGFSPDLAGAAPAPRATVIRTHPWRWFAGGAAAAAAMAAVLVALLLPPHPPRDIGGVVPWVAPAQLRGASVATVTVAPGTPTLTLLLGTPTDFDPTQPAIVDVRSPGGTHVLHAAIPAADLQRSTLAIMLTMTPAITAGVYDVTLSQTQGTPQITSFEVIWAAKNGDRTSSPGLTR